MLAEIEQLIAENHVVLFLKGSSAQPRCGFSAAAAQVLARIGHPFAEKDALEEAEYRYVLAERSGWPTLPQLFVNGELVGGCDVIHELFRTGELQRRLDAAFSS
ncbi:MAG: glutaredoxin [Planctomycetota bacterium]|nr:MAG: glutaredoxin [Planctomycetota bacterium]